MEENKQNTIRKELISDALGGVNIITFDSEPAVAKGEHYLSTLLRVNVTYRRDDSNADERTTIIFKTFPGGVLEYFIKETGLLSKEIICYYKIIPVLTDILGKQLTPKHLGPMKKDILILEDLTLKGYKMANRTEKMDFRHCKASMEVLADLHAVSIIANNKDPKIFDDVKNETIYTDRNSFQRNFVFNGFKCMADEFDKISHFKHFSDKIRPAGERIWKDVVEAVKPKADETNVFNHGDFWTTNILFRYDKQNNIEDVKIIDFQFCHWTSPAMDLQMFFSTSLRDRMDIPKLTSIYLKCLNKHFDVDIISAEQLEKSMKRFNCFGLLLSVCTTPICILDSKNKMDFENTSIDDYTDGFPEDSPYAVAFKDKRYQEIIPEILNYYIDLGLL